MKYALALALMISAGAAQAGGPVMVAEEPPVVIATAPSSDWTGIYLGLSAVSGAFVLTDGAFSLGDSIDGFGLQAGYLHDFGSFVLGGELAYATGNYDFYDANWTSTQLKLIGGYDAGRVLTYGFVGLSRHESSVAILGGGTFSDTMTLYGLGAKLAVAPRVTVGMEYFVETTNDFAGTGYEWENNGLALSVDYRFSGAPNQVAAVDNADWTGIYLGLSAVLGSLTIDNGAAVGGDSADGFGLHAGYLRDFGSFVLGGELAYATGNYDFYDDDWTSTQLKLIGGYDVGRVLTYGFAGLSRLETDYFGAPLSGTMTLYGLGAKLAVAPKVTVGMEYFVETTNDFASTGYEWENNGLALSVDYRF